MLFELSLIIFFLYNIYSICSFLITFAIGKHLYQSQIYQNVPKLKYLLCFLVVLSITETIYMCGHPYVYSNTIYNSQDALYAHREKYK